MGAIVVPPAYVMILFALLHKTRNSQSPGDDSTVSVKYPVVAALVSKVAVAAIAIFLILRKKRP